MAEELPKPVDPEQVAQAAALEDAPVNGGVPTVTVPIEIQQDTEQDVPDQIVDDIAPADAHIEERTQELRNRGRVGVLTEGTERPDTSDRMKNSDHDPEGITVVNKANKPLSVARNQDPELTIYRDESKANTGRTFRTAAERKLEDVVEVRENRRSPRDPELGQYLEDPDGWEARRREGLRERGNHSDEEIEQFVEYAKERNDQDLARIDKEWNDRRDGWLQEGYEKVKATGKRQDRYRGNLLELYSRDPEKYKAMTTEEFVAEGREFMSDGSETSRLASLESWGNSLEEKLPTAVEEATNIADFCESVNEAVYSLCGKLQRGYIGKEELISFVEALEGKEVPDRDTVVGTEGPEREAAIEAFRAGQLARQDTEDRIAGVNGRFPNYFRVEDFVKDLDRSPREQMNEAVERVKAVTSKWIEDGQKARAEYDERWGKAPEKEEPEPEAA